MFIETRVKLNCEQILNAKIAKSVNKSNLILHYYLPLLLYFVEKFG